MKIAGAFSEATNLIELVQTRLAAGVNDGTFSDCCFIGNTSEKYPWSPCHIVDIDMFIFDENLDTRLGLWLQKSEAHLKRELDNRGYNFELRIIEGPYKPNIRKIDRTHFVAHLGVFTENSYKSSCELKRWGWKKYKCIKKSDRLAALSPPSLTLKDFLYAKKGLIFRYNALSRGEVPFDELLLPDFRNVKWCVSASDPLFAECCFSYALNSARNHARCKGYAEPDTLPNEKFFTWYSESVFPSTELLELYRMKEICRQQGYMVDNNLVHGLSLAFLTNLLKTCL